jgi:hypothetical protein
VCNQKNKQRTTRREAPRECVSEGMVTCWAMLRLAFQSVFGLLGRVCVRGITRATAGHLTARAER